MPASLAKPPGKTVADEFYVHLSVLEHVVDEVVRNRIAAVVDRMPPVVDETPNVAKLNLRSGRVSLLLYPGFFESPFPALSAAWVFPPSGGPPQFRTYRETLNPPILHRKELLVDASHPRHSDWEKLTASAASLGLFDDSSTIGFQLNWSRTIESKGYRLVGNQFVPLGNEVGSERLASQEAPGSPVERHLTALSRTSLSAPVQLLLRSGLLIRGVTFFDYGCGRGGDMSGLAAAGFDVNGWDPHFLPDAALLSADVVNLGFVINVIEDPAERIEALTRAFSLARVALAVSAMLYTGDTPGRRYLDGYLTSRNTFQKYFSQSELKDYVEQALHRDAFMIGPGVALVFASSEAEQRFSAGRCRRRALATRLLHAALPHRVRIKSPRDRRSESRVRRLSRTAERLALVKPTLDRLWATVLDLGREPEPDEVLGLAEIEREVGTLSRALRLVSRHYDHSLLEAAARIRADDVRLLMATRQFAKRAAYRQLEPRLQRDIRVFFGDYRSAQDAGLQLLFDASDPAKILVACESAAVRGLGCLEGEHSLQLHVDMVERLPAVLRAYVACGLILWDSLSEVQLVKIHIPSAKLTLMEFDEFDVDPLPRLRRRIKVNVRKLDYDVFDYGSLQFPKPVLYRKSRYLHEDYPGFADQFAFDESLERTGLLGDSEFGPPAEVLVRTLEDCRLSIAGHRLVPSTRLPDLDASCGANFTYRAFVECGDTQQLLKLPNLPLNPATYNALHAMAVNLLDPIVDYFGSIRLTYGFASTALTRRIAGSIAPKVDQHAACECTANGKPICDRGGAACDFIVDDEDMREVTQWIIEHLPFDRLYFYGANRPIHLSFSETPARLAFEMTPSLNGRRIPRLLK